MNMDEQFLKETFGLARKGLGQTNPNPMAGALIVKGVRIFGKGYHKKAGLPHAEIEALNACKESVKGATLYVNLEPCSYFGKTPPCVDEIIKSGIRRVVCATYDPNPRVLGKGIAALKKSGINVTVGLLEKEARQLNEAFFTFHEKKRPFIVLKFASSLDGKMSSQSGDSKWITNEKARTFARKLRGQYQAVLVGINTILKDNPNLGNGLRIILDSTLKIPPKAQVIRDTNVIIATTIAAEKLKKKILEKKGFELLTFREKQIPINKLLKKLWEREILSVFVEGGKTVLESFINEGVVDKVHAFYGPMLLGRAQNLKDAKFFKNISFKRFGDNILINGF